MESSVQKSSLSGEQKLFLGLCILWGLWIGLLVIFQEKFYAHQKASFKVIQEKQFLQEIAGKIPDLSIERGRKFAHLSSLCVTDQVFSRIRTKDVALRYASFTLWGDELFKAPPNDAEVKNCLRKGAAAVDLKIE